MQKDVPIPVLLRRWEASEYLREVHGIQYTRNTLALFACQGKGPEITFVGNVPFYRPASLDAWAKALISKPTPRARKYAHPRYRKIGAAKLARASNPSADSTNA
jgi:hypothetical protein